MIGPMGREAMKLYTTNNAIFKDTYYSARDYNFRDFMMVFDCSDTRLSLRQLPLARHPKPNQTKQKPLDATRKLSWWFTEWHVCIATWTRTLDSARYLHIPRLHCNWKHFCGCVNQRRRRLHLTNFDMVCWFQLLFKRFSGMPQDRHWQNWIFLSVSNNMYLSKFWILSILAFQIHIWPTCNPT